MKYNNDLFLEFHLRLTHSLLLKNNLVAYALIKIACDLSEQSESHPETVRITQATWTLLIFFIINYVVKEMLKLAASPRSYFVQPESYLDIIIILMTTLIIWINLMPEVLYIRTVGLIFLFRSYNRFKERGLRTTFFLGGGHSSI